MQQGGDTGPSSKLGISGIGGSQIIQHWNVPDDKNQAKAALKTGNVDVLTLSPIFLPDAGIENFTKLALEHNKDIRILVQPIWLRWDIYEPTTQRPAKVDHNAITGEELRQTPRRLLQGNGRAHPGPEQENGQDGALRGPGQQGRHRAAGSDHRRQGPRPQVAGGLFVDELGHGTAPLRVLVAYCNYAVMYRRSPIGLPVPEDLKGAKLGDQEEPLNKLLQQLAWDAVIQHPLSGVLANEQP